jgi:hypothetical protein
MTAENPDAKADKLNTSTIVLPAAILQQDAVVIDEQENHVVLTVRLPIDLVRNNHTTLMALYEIATGKSAPPAEPDKGDLDAVKPGDGAVQS